jgi:hypothetical protein
LALASGDVNTSRRAVTIKAGNGSMATGGSIKFHQVLAWPQAREAWLYR